MIHGHELVAAVDDLCWKTERLLVRRFCRGDLAIALQHELDPQIMRYVRDIPHMDAVRAKVESFVAPWHAAEGEWLGLPITLPEDDAMMGILALRISSLDNQTVEIGYRLGVEFHRRGYVFEACQRLLEFLFDTVGAHKVIAMCVAENEASYRLMEKLGMQREGCLREFSQLGGRWCDELIYGLLSTDL